MKIIDTVVIGAGQAGLATSRYLTEAGRDRAYRYNAECTYFGAAPVSLPEYLKAMEAQSIAKQEATEEELKEHPGAGTHNILAVASVTLAAMSIFGTKPIARSSLR
jgi:pyruvate/2-oxoglutarate dehydrogenase complex dihydrolipoamide dehydrogenase (E3) component